jgi:CheY-like chemotaxis protein
LKLEGESLPAPRSPRPGWLTQTGGKLEFASEKKSGGESVETWKLVLPETLPQKVGKSMPRVLAVDTRDVIRDLLAGMLGQLGYQPVVVESSAEAMRLFKDGVKSGERFDIVIADYAIDSISGLKLASDMKASDPELFFLLTPGWGMDLDPDSIKKSGVDMILEKPFRIEQLSDAIRGVGKRAPAE